MVASVSSPLGLISGESILLINDDRFSCLDLGDGDRFEFGDLIEPRLLGDLDVFRLNPEADFNVGDEIVLLKDVVFICGGCLGDDVIDLRLFDIFCWWWFVYVRLIWF